MRILILSKSGDALGIAHRMQLEGNQVKMYIQDARYRNAGQGLVERVPSWRPHVLHSDLVICDMVGFGKQQDTLEKFGKPVLMCNKFADMAELDRAKGMDLFNKMGVNTPETYTFNTPEEALDILDMWEDPGYVLKPFGNIDTGKTYVIENERDYEWALSTYKPEQKLIVQKIVNGIEVSTEGWYNGRQWIKPFNHTFEEKRFMPSNIGRNTGCMGNVVIPASEKSKLVQETVMRIEPWLKRINYRGCIDINCIVDSLNCYALEFTIRMGYDAIEALAEGMTEPLSDFLFEVALGIKKEMALKPGMFMAVRVSVPPWPMDEPDEDDKGRPIHGITSEALRHIFLTDAMLKDGEYQYAAGDGVVFKVTAQGATVKEAQSRINRSLTRTFVHDMQYRDDIGDRVKGDLAQLKDWGWIV